MIKHTKVSILFLMLFSVFSIQQVSHAEELHGVEFVQELKNEGTPLVLKGIALKRAFFMKAFVAGFYLEENVLTENIFDNVTKRIEVNYLINIPGEKLSNYTEKLMKKNTTDLEFESIEERVKIMRKYFVDLTPGDRFALTYVPDMGTKFEFNGELVGMIEGQDFAKGLFSTWLGDKPMDKKLKRRILGLEG